MMEKQLLNEKDEKNKIKEKPEEYVHAEGKISGKNSTSPGEDTEYEYKSGGDTIVNVKGTELKRNKPSSKIDDKSKNVPESEIVPVTENTSTEYLKDIHISKSEKNEENETSLKGGDKKRVKFIIENDPKIPWDGRFQHMKGRDSRIVYNSGKTSETKRQQHTPEKDRSPQRDRTIDKGKRMSKGKDGPKKTDNCGDTDADDSGEEYCSKSGGDNSAKLSSDNERDNSSKVRRRPQSQTHEHGSSAKRSEHRSSSARNKNGTASVVKTGKENIMKSSKTEKCCYDAKMDSTNITEIENETSEVPISKLCTYPMADVENTGTDEGNFKYDNMVDNDETSSDAGKEEFVEKEDVQNSEKHELPNSVIEQQMDVDVTVQTAATESVTAATESVTAADIPLSWSEWYLELLDTSTRASCYRVTLFLGWLLWAAWIMRLMGFNVFKGINVLGVLSNVGLLELIGVVEVFGLLQVMWLRRNTQNRQQSPPDHVSNASPTHDLADKKTPSVASDSKNICDTPQADNLDFSNEEQTIASTVLE